MVEKRNLPNDDDEEVGLDLVAYKPRAGQWGYILAPFYWLRMLAMEMHWSFVLGVIVVYGLSQGLGGSLYGVGTEYYMKDVLKVQPSESQIYRGIVNIPWMVKPLWGLFTDVVPVFGYRRRPYFLFAGLVGVASMLFLSLHKTVHIILSLLTLTSGSAAVAIADVTIDACIAENSNKHQPLAADMQSLCALSSSIGALLGFSLSGILVHLIGPGGVYGLLAIPSALIFLVGVLLSESQVMNFSYGQVGQNFGDAAWAMWTTLKLPEVWRPCLYMYLSLSLSLNINEAMFYWYTSADGGPHFSQEFVGIKSSVGSAGSLVGAILYQYTLKNYHFRDLCLWTQLFYGLTGMLDLVLVLRLNLRFGISDYFFAVIDDCVLMMIARLKWMPLLVLSSKLCPPGIEGTFFALLMSIDNAGLFTSSSGGGFLMHILNITRTRFDYLWIAVLIRNVLRISVVGLLFLVPKAAPNSYILSTGVPGTEEDTEVGEVENIELVSLINNNEMQ